MAVDHAPLLVSSSQWFGVVHAGGRVEVIDSGRGTYMGITWDHAHVYVVSLANDGVWGSERGGVHPVERLIIYGPGFEIVDEVVIPTLDAHEIAVTPDGAIAICNTGRDEIVLWSAPGRFDHYRLPPEGLVPKHADDRHHLNTIRPLADGGFYVLIMNDGQARGVPRQSQMARVALEGDSLRILERTFVGYEAHSLVLLGEHGWTASSAEELLVHFDVRAGWRRGEHPLRLPFNGYPRGLACAEDLLFAGIGARGRRAERHKRHARLGVFGLDDVATGARRARASYQLKNAGQVYNVRSTAPVDAGHLGHHPFPWTIS